VVRNSGLANRRERYWATPLKAAQDKFSEFVAEARAVIRSMRKAVKAHNKKLAAK
jgi:hypothetical protein